MVTGRTKKELLRNLKKTDDKTYRPPTEELLRFALEKTSVDVVLGMETIHPKDSVHYVRGGLDHVTCAIAARKKKTIGFSFTDVVNSFQRGKLLARMRLNLRLCKKFKVTTKFFPDGYSERDVARFEKAILTGKKK